MVIRKGLRFHPPLSQGVFSLRPFNPAEIKKLWCSGRAHHHHAFAKQQKPEHGNIEIDGDPANGRIKDDFAVGGNDDRWGDLIEVTRKHHCFLNVNHVVGTGDRRKAVGSAKVVNGRKNMVFGHNIVRNNPVRCGFRDQYGKKDCHSDKNEQDHAPPRIW